MHVHGTCKIKNFQLTSEISPVSGTLIKSAKSLSAFLDKKKIKTKKFPWIIANWILLHRESWLLSSYLFQSCSAGHLRPFRTTLRYLGLLQMLLCPTMTVILSWPGYFWPPHYFKLKPLGYAFSAISVGWACSRLSVYGNNWKGNKASMRMRELLPLVLHYVHVTNRMSWTGYFQLSQTSVTLYYFFSSWDFKIEVFNYKKKNRFSLKPNKETKLV